jgi:membrane protein DedA with SNARE-associated domain
MGIVDFILSLLSSYPEICSYLVGVFLGEETIMFLSFLSSQGYLPILTVFIFSTLGTFTSDLFFFSISKIRYFQNLEKESSLYRQYQKIDTLVGRLTKENHLLILFYTKFIYGTRIMTIMYLGVKGVSFRKFLIFNSIITILWSLVIVSLGWLAGQGYLFILDLFRNIQLAIFFILLLIIVLLVIKKWIQKKLTREQEK